MNKGILYLLWYSVKYEIKRSYIFIGIILLIYLLFLSGASGINNNISSGIKSVNIIDEDNSGLSRNFTSYLQSINITTSPESINKVVIPKGFEEDFNNKNATLIIGSFGVGSGTVYEYQLYRINERNRIKSESILFDDNLITFIVALFFISALLTFFYESRISGNIYFITNHLSFLSYFVLSHLVFMIMVLYFIISGAIPLKILLLLSIIFLMSIVLVFYQRNNTKLVQNINFILYAVGFLFIIGRIVGLKSYPLVDLLFRENSPIMFIDVTIFIVLLIIVSRIRLTE